MGRSSSFRRIGGNGSFHHKDVLLWHSHPVALLCQSLPVGVIRNSTVDTDKLTLYTTFWWEMGYKDIIVILDLLLSANLSLLICNHSSTQLLSLGWGT